MCDNFYNKLNSIYNKTNTKNKFGKNGYYEISKNNGGLKKTRSEHYPNGTILKQQSQII